SRVPVLIQELYDEDGKVQSVISPWECEVTRTFDMARFGQEAQNATQLEERRLIYQDGFYRNEAEIWIPILESKTFGQYDHRAATYNNVPQQDVLKGNAHELDLSEKQQPGNVVKARFWLASNTVSKYTEWHNEDYWLAYRNVARSTDIRTTIATILPRRASDYTVRLAYGGEVIGKYASSLLSNLNCFCFDYVTRQSVAGANFSDYIMKQMPVIPPHTYTPALLDFIVPRVLELTYTAWDLQPFAQDVGYDGPPFVWDEERRFLMRCELDARYFHLYQIQRDDVDYILETFPIVKRKDEASYGSYRTKDTIMSMYDEMAALPKLAVPAPKQPPSQTLPPQGEGLQMYDVPDVSQWQTWL